MEQPSTSSDGWLRAFCQSDAFFKPCTACSNSHSAREAQLNYWDVETQTPLCSVCVGPQAGNVLQVRRSSYHDVVKVADIARLADIGGIQTYVINGSKVVFLRRRPQPRPPKGACGASQCTVCSRHLQDVSLYCSVECKLDGPGTPSSSGRTAQLPSGKAGLLRAAAAADSHSTHSGGPDTPSHLESLRPFDSDSDSMGSSAQLGSSGMRRKGRPARAPLQ